MAKQKTKSKINAAAITCFEKRAWQACTLSLYHVISCLARDMPGMERVHDIVAMTTSARESSEKQGLENGGQTQDYSGRPPQRCWISHDQRGCPGTSQHFSKLFQVFAKNGGTILSYFLFVFQVLHQNFADVFVEPSVVGLLECDWDAFIREKKKVGHLW